MEYLPTKLGYFWGKYREIFHTWSIWVWISIPILPNKTVGSGWIYRVRHVSSSQGDDQSENAQAIQTPKKFVGNTGLVERSTGNRGVPHEIQAFPVNSQSTQCDSTGSVPVPSFHASIQSLTLVSSGLGRVVPDWGEPSSYASFPDIPSTAVLGSGHPDWSLLMKACVSWFTGCSGRWKIGDQIWERGPATMSPSWIRVSERAASCESWAGEWEDCATPNVMIFRLERHVGVLDGALQFMLMKFSTQLFRLSSWHRLQQRKMIILAMLSNKQSKTESPKKATSQEESAE